MNTMFPKISPPLTLIIAICFLIAAAIAAKAQEEEEPQQRQGAVKQERKVERGSRVAIRNNFGNMTVAGWGRDTIKAVARDETSGETVEVGISEISTVPNKFLITVKPGKRSSKGKISLEVKLPRDVELEPVETESDSITISDFEGFINAKTISGNIKIFNVGSVQARTGNGNISLENVSGRADVITATGNLDVKRIKGDARIIAVSARINLSCVKGRVEISDTSSEIFLTGVEGDVDVSTSNGKAYFTGAIRAQNRYRLKTLSGVVSMAIPEGAGFIVSLSSYSGKIEKDFTFQNDSAFRPGKKEQRFTGKHGDAKAQIELDSFNGTVSFRKIGAGAVVKGCESTND